MSTSNRENIHPTAIVSAEAHLAEDVRVGPYALIEGPVELGAGCVIGPYVHLIGPLTMGQNNRVFSHSIIGGRPQDAKYREEVTRVEIGDDNVFREHVTVHRGTRQSWVTRIGNHNTFMVASHVGHDCEVGDNCLLANNALLGGHCHLADNVYMSGNTALHQFVRVGRFAMIGGCSASTKDVPPFVTLRGINIVRGLNLVGIRRAGFSAGQINALRRLYHVIYLQGNILPVALAQVQRECGNVDVVEEFVTFVRSTKRGISGTDSEVLSEAA